MATRREFIKMGAIATIAGLTSVSSGKVPVSSQNGLFRIPPESIGGRLYSLTSDKFRPLVNEDFLVRSTTSGGKTALKLIEVKDIAGKAGFHTNSGSGSFSLLLKENVETGRLPQDIYRISHNQLGTFTVLMVPVTLQKNYYEVIFNRL